MRPQRGILTVSLALAVALAAGCSQQYYVREADEQVYKLLRQSQQEELGYDRNLSIEDSPSRNVGLSAEEIIGELPLAGPQPQWLAESGLAKIAGPVREIDLAASLRLARRHSREFQTQKEKVYTAGLALTTQVHAFETQFAFFGGVAGRVEGEPRRRSLDTWADFSITRDLITGAVIALDVGLTGVKYLNHELGTTLQSALGLTASQPLWRGADRRVVLNNLTQAEHDVIYGLRNFARYEKTFAVNIASSYYRVLLQLARVENEWNNYQNLIKVREDNEWRAKAGRLPVLERDQALQSELRAHNSYLVAVQGYERELDGFRILLGLPTDAPVVLSRKPIEKLAEEGTRPLDLRPEVAAQVALERRLDLKNSRGGVQDADRGILVAADALKGELNLFGQMNVSSTPETRAGRFMFHEGLYEFGLEIDLPLERLAERNAFRQALIASDVSIRSYMALVDSIKQDVRAALRELKRTEESYKIQKASVALAERRVAGTQMQKRAGRATTRDLLESQEALVTAQNALSEALVAHQVARLGLLRDLELLEVDEQGQIHEGDIHGILQGPNGQAAAPAEGSR